MTESLLCAGALRFSHVVFTGRGKLDKQKESNKTQLISTRITLATSNKVFSPAHLQLLTCSLTSTYSDDVYSNSDDVQYVVRSI